MIYGREEVWLPIIEKYYYDNPPLKELLMVHSRLVAQKAIEVACAHPELELDKAFIEEASMLHDIGIFLTDAKPVHCFGKHPYICHGYLGAELLRKEGLERHALVAERHTGTGLTLEQIVARDLPVPHRNMVPLSMEEKVVCFADKFYSKTRPTQQKSPEQAVASLQKFGKQGVEVFQGWCREFL